MLLEIIKTDKTLSKRKNKGQELSTEINLNYNKSTLERSNNTTSIHVDRAVTGKGEFANVRTYTQNLVKKFDLTGNKEVCVRKILIAEREDSLFDVTVRELKVYHRKDKKHHFNKVTRFKTPIGTIEHVIELIKNQGTQKSIIGNPKYLLN